MPTMIPMFLLLLPLLAASGGGGGGGGGGSATACMSQCASQTRPCHPRTTGIAGHVAADQSC